MGLDRSWSDADMTGSSDLDASAIVTCACCQSQFEAISLGQAEGCHADILGNVILGSEGSVVACGLVFRFLAGRQPPYLTRGQICDECISQLISDGAIEEAASSTHHDQRSGLTIVH